jgi:hypothetical protein
MSKVFESLVNGSLLDPIGGNNGTLTAGVSRGFVQTDKGLALEMDGANTKVVYGDIENIKSIGLWINLDTTTEQILEGSANDKLIHASTGTLTYTDFDNAYIDNVDTNTITTGWHCVVITSTTDVDMSAVTLALNNTSYGKFQCAKVTFWSEDVSTKTRNEYYANFLASSQIGQPKRGFSLDKPKDLSDEIGLVAGYNMTLDEDGTVSDLSGNGNDGTNNGCLPSEDGLVFNGVDTGVTASSINLGSGSFGIYTKVIFYSSGINQSIIAGDNSGPFTFRLDWLSTGRVSVNIFSQNSGSNSLGFNETYSFLLGEDYTIVMGFNFLTKTITIYINGEQLAGSTTEIGTFVSMANTATYGFGHIPRATTLYHLDGEILDIKLKTVLPTAQEAIDYHNSFILPTLVETFDEGADGIAKLPREWIAGTGTYKISQVNQSDTLPTFPGGIKLYDKYLECTVAGTSGTLSYQGTGTYSWDMFKGGDGNTTTFNFINSLVGAGNRYSIDINSDESVSLEKDGSNLFVTAASYTSINTWYHFDVTVTKAGIRTALMDGIEIVEATGSNPVTDTDYMTSIFTSIDFDAGDRVANFNYKDEIEQ